MHLLLSILADGEEQARRLLGELPPAADDQLPLRQAEECCRGVARQLRCTFAKAIAVAKAIEVAHGAASGTDSPRSADESSGAAGVATQAQVRPGICKRRCVYMYDTSMIQTLCRHVARSTTVHAFFFLN